MNLLQEDTRFAWYRRREERLFLDGSISSFKAVLIKQADAKCIPFVLAKAEKETHFLLENLLSLIKYKEYNWQVCVLISDL